MTRPATTEFRTSRSKSQHGFVIGAVCALVGFALLLFAGERIADRHLLGGLLLALGAGVALYAWGTGRRAGTQLRIDAAGVWFREWDVTVPWTAIEDVYQSGSRLQPFVSIRLRDGEAFLAGLPPKEGRKLRGNRLWKEPELRIPYNAVEATQQEMLAAIQGGMNGRT